tara:strand:- start:77 stop:397 length:321 start_codon:yes stop_codon:yes gene_type:complete
MTTKAITLKQVEYKGKKIKLPFEILSTTARDETLVTKAYNRFTQESIELPLFAQSVYRSILNSEWKATLEDKQAGFDGASKLWDKVRKGLDWFRRHFAKAYMVLLD